MNECAFSKNCPDCGSENCGEFKCYDYLEVSAIKSNEQEVDDVNYLFSDYECPDEFWESGEKLARDIDKLLECNKRRIPNKPMNFTHLYGNSCKIDDTIKGVEYGM